MSRTMKIRKLKLFYFQKNARYRAKELCRNIFLGNLSLNEGKISVGLPVLILEFWWRHVKTKNNASLAFRMPSLFDFISSRGMSSILLIECLGRLKWSDWRNFFFQPMGCQTNTNRAWSHAFTRAWSSYWSIVLFTLLWLDRIITFFWGGGGGGYDSQSKTALIKNILFRDKLPKMINGAQASKLHVLLSKSLERGFIFCGSNYKMWSQNL